MYQLVLKNGKVIATHKLSRDIRGLYPGCEVVLYDKELPENEDGTPILDDPRTQKEKKQAWVSKRRYAYPTIEEQLDMLYHDTKDGTTKWVDALTAIKLQYPKSISEII